MAVYDAIIIRKHLLINVRFVRNQKRRDLAMCVVVYAKMHRRLTPSPYPPQEERSRLDGVVVREVEIGKVFS